MNRSYPENRQENGFETKEYVPLEDIEKITITRYYDTEEHVYYEEYGYDSYYYEETVAIEEELSSASATYNDSEQIPEFVKPDIPDQSVKAE